MTLSRLWAFLAVGLPVLAGLISNLTTVDLTYHLRAGGMILDRSGIPTTDTFTFTASGQPWLDQQWGAQVVLAAVFRVAGWTGLVLLRAGLVGIVSGLTFLVCRRQGLPVRPSAWLTLAAFVVTAPALALRPQLIGMVLFGLTLVLILERHRDPRVTWVIVPVAIVWANVHGSFFLAPLVVGLALLQDVFERRERARETFFLAVAVTAATIVGPFGLSVWPYATGLSTNSFVTTRIAEWEPTSLRTIPGILFFASALLVAAFLASRGRRPPWPALVWFAAFFLIGAYAIRGIAWWPPAAVAGIAVLLGAAGASAESTEQSRPINGLIAAALILAGVALLPVWRPLDAGLRAPAGVVGVAPSGLTANLRSIARPGDRLFHPQVWGSWFEFAVPEVLTTVDSRIEVFPEQVWEDYDEVASGRTDATAVLDRWAVTLVVVDKDQDELRAALTTAGWQETYQDPDGALLVRAGR